MLRLVVFAPALGAPSASPFCTKALCLLEMAGVKYERIIGDSRKSPKKKLPVLKDGDRQIADSDAIRAYLEETLPFDFDAGLSAEDRAISRAFIRLTEEHLYFAVVSERWMNDHNWARVKQAGSGMDSRDCGCKGAQRRSDTAIRSGHGAAQFCRATGARRCRSGGDCNADR